MLRICLLALCLSVLGMATKPAYASTKTSVMAGEDKIKVLLVEKKPAALVEVRGGYKVYDAKTASKLGFGLLGKAYPVEAIPEGLRWGEAFPDVYQITIVADEGSSLLVNGIEYKGCVSCYNVAGKICVVNTLSLDDYVAATLSQEFAAALAPEVMNAIAIAARTQAYYLAQKDAHAPWHVEAKASNYHGLAMTRRGNGVDEAVQATRGVVMKRSGYEPFVACWTAHCAGKTVPTDLIFRREYNAVAKAIQMPLAAADRDNARWSFSMPTDELKQALGLTALAEMTPFVDKESGKVYNLRVSDGKKSHDFDFLTLQSALGAARLKSSEFSVVRQDGKITFSGFGEGTGAGLCLYSAEQMAAKGKDAGEILNEFFPDTKLVHVQ